MPFITEELYLHLFAKEEEKNSIHISEWPKFNKEQIDNKIDKVGDRFIEIVKQIRQFKSQNGKSLKAEIDLVLETSDKNLLADVIDDLRATVNAKEISFGKFSFKLI